MAKVIAPNKQYSGISAGVPFANGVGETDNPNLLKWFESKGYEVGRPEPEQDNIPIEKMTVPQLKEYAALKKIDLGEASKKEDILKTIQDFQNQAVGEPKVVEE
ncbi:SAP domain-containing protein [Paenibacillus sp. M1]|uniref:SAP domain-containing protein n=1 Tax=Paenibacillus haidiansis TaxID=1574488 RepID=A0ABU7W260_9BACL